MLRIVLFLLITISSLNAQQFGQDNFGMHPFGQAAFGHESISAAFSLTDISGLNAWFKSENIPTGADSSTISTSWTDASGNGYDATVAGDPEFLLSAVNGLNAVYLDGTGDWFNFTWDSSASVTFFVVSTARPLGSYMGLLSMCISGTVTGIVAEYAPAGFLSIRQATGSTSTQTVDVTTGNTAWQIISVRRDNSTTTMRVYINGTLKGTESSQALTFADKNASIGRLYTSLAALGFVGNIAEVALFNTYLDDTDYDAALNYLNNKFGIY